MRTSSETLVDQARWSDFGDALVSVRGLRDVEYERFGAYFSFTRQAAGENSFNFMLVLAATSGPQTRTKAYFSSDRWWATGSHGISGDLVPIFQRAQKREAASGKNQSSLTADGPPDMMAWRALA